MALINVNALGEGIVYSWTSLQFVPNDTTGLDGFGSKCLMLTSVCVFEKYVRRSQTILCANVSVDESESERWLSVFLSVSSSVVVVFLYRLVWVYSPTQQEGPLNICRLYETVNVQSPSAAWKTPQVFQTARAETHKKTAYSIIWVI